VLGTLLGDVERAAAAWEVSWSLTGRAAMGVVRAHLSGPPAHLAGAAVMIRSAALRLGGHAQFLAAMHDGVELDDPFGPLGSAAAVAGAVKQRFDPAGVLPYPWHTSSTGAPA
jgi:hypothetical protein